MGRYRQNLEDGVEFVYYAEEQRPEEGKDDRHLTFRHDKEYLTHQYLILPDMTLLYLQDFGENEEARQMKFRHMPDFPSKFRSSTLKCLSCTGCRSGRHDYCGYGCFSPIRQIQTEYSCRKLKRAGRV
ncbi:MAG: hypothetical protein JW774_08225 [Candidatus Aureabacteria bacterium]|nr:hypothetical protein [Candidatus Auribacterota bacterium]